MCGENKKKTECQEQRGTRRDAFDIEIEIEFDMYATQIFPVISSVIQSVLTGQLDLRLV